MSSNDNVSGSRSGRGFYAGSGGRLVTDAACSASGNDFAGFQIDRGSTGTVNGIASRNWIGVAIYGTGGSSTTLSGDDNERFGLILDYAASGWTFASVSFSRTGFSARNPSGTGVEIFGGSGNVIQSATLVNNAGYGVALARDRNGNPAVRNRIGTVQVRATGNWDADPAIHLSGGASDNSFADVTATGTTCGVSIGEGMTPTSNDRNVFTKLKVVGNPYCAVKIDGGSSNVFSAISVQGSGTFDPVRIASGLIELQGPDTRRNTVKISVASVLARTSSAVHADAGAAGNTVRLATLVKTQLALARDDARRNTFTVVKAAG